MRDPKRIPKLLAVLQDYWEKCPDLRFGQLIENLKSFSGKFDLFYVEDDEFEKLLKDYFNKSLN